MRYEVRLSVSKLNSIAFWLRPVIVSDRLSVAVMLGHQRFDGSNQPWHVYDRHTQTVLSSEQATVLADKLALQRQSA